MINVIMWIVVGAFVGWVASIIMKTNAEQGALANIAVGILGAFIGGFLVSALTGHGINVFSLGGIVVSIIGAVILLAIVKAFRGRNQPTHTAV